MLHFVVTFWEKNRTLKGGIKITIDIDKQVKKMLDIKAWSWEKTSTFGREGGGAWFFRLYGTFGIKTTLAYRPKKSKYGLGKVTQRSFVLYGVKIHDFEEKIGLNSDLVIDQKSWGNAQYYKRVLREKNDFWGFGCGVLRMCDTF